MNDMRGEPSSPSTGSPPRRRMRKRSSSKMGGRAARSLATVALATCGFGAFAGAAQASGAPQGPPAGPTTPPFTQCPAIGLDSSCEFLVDVTNANPATNPLVLEDSSVGYYDGSDDITVAVQNDSSVALGSVHLGIKGSGDDTFGFDGDGLCSPPSGPSPEGCPFGPPGDLEGPFDYAGPDTELNTDPETADSGTVVFPTPLQPGQYTYFTLESEFGGDPYLGAGEGNDAIFSTLTDGTSPEPQSASELALPAQANVTDQATIKGPNGEVAEGTVTYRLYADASCTKELFKSTETITTPGEQLPASEPIGAALPTNAKYYWLVEYSGNKGARPNSPVVSFCGNETMTFGTPPAAAQAAVTTNLVASNGTQGASIAVPVGTAIKDSAAVTFGGQSQSGRVTYYVFSDPGCTSQIRTINLGGGVASGGVFPSSASVTLPLGTYYFQAVYSGNGGVGPSRSACGSEVLTVATPSPPPPPPTSAVTVEGITVGTGGVITIVFVPQEAGTGTLTVTVPTASIARRHKIKKCKKGTIKIKGRCLPAASVVGIVTGHGTAGVPLTLTVKASGKTLKALQKGHTLTVSASLIYQSARGGAPSLYDHAVTINGHRRSKHHKKKR